VPHDPVAVSLGHLGVRTDWRLLRAVCERLPGLTLLLVGAYHDDEAAGDPDYAWCRACPQIVWFGRLDDEAAARVILLADVGIVPFKAGPYNDAGLPYRILKYARLGRRTVSPDLAGVKTWALAVTTAADAGAFAAALLEHAGARRSPDTALREWALAQTAEAANAPLWDRLVALGVAK
jgi:hypothetical protein